VLVPDGVPTSLGSGIFGLVAAGVFASVEEAQSKLCLPYKTFTPRPAAVARYEQLFALYRAVYFNLGQPGSEARSLGEVLPALRRIAAEARNAIHL
jgi:L-ribulokinase